MREGMRPVSDAASQARRSKMVVAERCSQAGQRVGAKRCKAKFPLSEVSVSYNTIIQIG
jgi:hypothetical protein